MRFVLLLLLTSALLADTEKGFKPLFNGKDLTGWKLMGGKGAGYIVENGAIVCTKGGGGNLLTEAEFANFVLRLEFRYEPGGNNGVGIRAPMAAKDIAYEGMEIQTIDNDHERYKGWLKPWQHHGSIYNVVAAKKAPLKPAGEWNQEEIIADGRHIVVKVNGTTVVDANLDDVKDPEVLKKHPGLKRTSGHIGFLGHDDRVEYRNIRIKTLP